MLFLETCNNGGWITGAFEGIGGGIGGGTNGSTGGGTVGGTGDEGLDEAGNTVEDVATIGGTTVVLEIDLLGFGGADIVGGATGITSGFTTGGTTGLTTGGTTGLTTGEVDAIGPDAVFKLIVIGPL